VAELANEEVEICLNESVSNRHVMDVKPLWKSHGKRASYLVVIVVVARHTCQRMPVPVMGKSQVSWRLIAAADTNSGSFRHLRVQSTNRAVKATIFTPAFSGCRRKHRASTEAGRGGCERIGALSLYF
jgi:hypothetical protein